MLDPTRLEALLRRGPAVKDAIDRYRAVDGQRRALQSDLDAARAKKNAANDKMAATKDKKSPEFAALRDELRAVSQQIKEEETRLAQLEADTRAAHLMLPNAPHESVPDGADETANPVVSTWGE